MTIEAIFTDVVAHAGVGVALSLLDFLTAKMANPKAVRLGHKQACLQSIEALLDAEQPPPTKASGVSETPGASTDTPPSPLEGGVKEEVPQKVTLPKDSTQYAEHVAIVRDYLHSSGMVKLQVPVMSRVKDGVKNLVLHEKINTLTNLQKLGVAFGVEVLYDILFEFSHKTMAGLAATLYQTPAFFAGLWLGNGVKKFLNFFITPGDEKKLAATIQQLLQETAIVDLIVKYAPSEQVKSELAAHGVQVYMLQLTQAGRGAYKRLQQFAKTAKHTADDVIHFSQKQQEKEQQERADRQKRFDELTKGR